MDNIAVIIGFVILAICGYRGYKEGIVKMAVYLAALFITVTLSTFLMKPVGAIVKENTSLYENIRESVLDVVKECEIREFSEIEELPFPEYMLEGLGDQSVMIGNIQEIVSEGIALQIFHAIIYIALNAVIYIVLRVIMGTMDVVTSLPVIKEFNHLFGLAIGLAEGILVLWIVFILLQACGSESWAQEIFTQIKGNDLMNWIYNHNLLANFFIKLL